jgi:hypothetical protein
MEQSSGDTTRLVLLHPFSKAGRFARCVEQPIGSQLSSKRWQPSMTSYQVRYRTAGMGLPSN